MSDVVSDQQRNLSAKKSRLPDSILSASPQSLGAPTMLRALQSTAVGGSPARTLSQLQRVHGNRQTLQMVREGARHRPVSQTIPAGGNMIQLDRLVEMQTGTDKKDFNITRSQVEASLGITSSGAAYKNKEMLAVNDPSEVLYLWGHMDSEKIGLGEFPELAQLMVGLGFRTCREIRLIGCNNQESPSDAPRNFWHALHHELSKLQTVGESSSSSTETPLEVKVPPIHATKGPLHSSLKEGFEKGWWVGTPSDKEDEVKEDQERIWEHMTNPNYVDAKPEQIPFLMNHYKQRVNFKPEPTNDTIGNREILRKYFETERINKQTSLKERKNHPYPTLMQEVEGDEGGKTKVWNPDAWVTYSGG